MQTIQFKINPPEKWLFSLSKQLGFTFDDDQNCITFDNTIGKGIIKGYEFQPGFWMAYYDVVMSEDLQVKRVAEPTNEYFTLVYYLEESNLNGQDETFPQYHARTNKVYFQTSMIEGQFRFAKNTALKLCMIAFSRYWLEQKVTSNLEMEDSIFTDLLVKNKPLFVTETLRAESKRLLQELQTPIAPSYLHFIVAESQTLELVTRFFTKLEQHSVYEIQHSLNIDDVQKILRIKDYLLSDLKVRPLIADLARDAAMSESKLKRLFHILVGESIYAFYQKHRLERAKVLLEQGCMSISNVGYEVGYSNLSHFSKAFRKQYGILPHQITTF